MLTEKELFSKMAAIIRSELEIQLKGIKIDIELMKIEKRIVELLQEEKETEPEVFIQKTNREIEEENAYAYT